MSWQKEADKLAEKRKLALEQGGAQPKAASRCASVSMPLLCAWAEITRPHLPALAGPRGFMFRP